METEGVGLRFGIEIDTGELDPHVAQHAAGIGIVRPSVNRTRLGFHAFGPAFAAGHRGIAEHDEPRPAASAAQSHGPVAGHHDRRLAAAFGHDLAALLHDQNRVLASGLDQRPGFDGQRGARVDEHLALDLVDTVVGPGRIRGDFHVPVAVCPVHLDHVFGSDHDELGPHLAHHLAGVDAAQLADEVPQAGRGRRAEPDRLLCHRRYLRGDEGAAAASCKILDFIAQREWRCAARRKILPFARFDVLPIDENRVQVVVAHRVEGRAQLHHFPRGVAQLVRPDVGFRRGVLQQHVGQIASAAAVRGMSSDRGQSRQDQARERKGDFSLHCLSSPHRAGVSAAGRIENQNTRKLVPIVKERPM